MLQILIAAIVALILLAVFGSAGDGKLKKTIGTILMWMLIGAVLIPLAYWMLVTIGPFALMVIVLFIVLRWLFSKTSPQH